MSRRDRSSPPKKERRPHSRGAVGRPGVGKGTRELNKTRGGGSLKIERGMNNSGLNRGQTNLEDYDLMFLGGVGRGVI